jgi:S1-C subfamily serine protease
MTFGRIMGFTVLLLLFLLVVPLSAQDQQASILDTIEITKRVKPGIVLIKGLTEDNKEISGSGFIVDGSGTIVTNLHIIQDLKSGGVRLINGDIYDKFVIRAIDERKDIAILQVAGFDLPILPLGNSNNLQTGEKVVIIGNPLGLEASVTTGIVSAIRQLSEGLQVIQTDAAANPGNSGGPMLNMKGEIVGVVSFKLSGAENLNFAIPINYVRGLLTGKDSFTLDQIRNKLGQAPDVFQEKSNIFPKRWKSLISNSIKIIRLDGDHIYIESVLPNEQQQLNNFTLYELKKAGDKYIGTIRGRFSCTYRSGWSWEPLMNTCNDESSIEITSLTSTRIEGWIMQYPKDDKFNCKKCTHSMEQQIKSPFVWIPE